MPLTVVRRGLLVIGVVLVIAAPALSLGSIMSRRRHIAEFQEAALSPAVLADSATRASVVYHLSRLQADEAVKWSPTGDATFGVAGTVAGFLLVAWSTLRRRQGA